MSENIKDIIMLKQVLSVLLLFILTNCSKERQPPSRESNIAIGYLKNARDEKVSKKDKLMLTRKALIILSTSPSNSVTMSKFVEMIEIFYSLNSWEDLKLTSTTLLQKGNESNSTFYKGMANRWLGIYYENMNEYDLAFKYYMKAEKFFREIHSERYLCYVFHDKAQAQRGVNDFLGAEESLVRALSIARKLNLHDELPSIYIDFGLICNEQHQYDKAKEYYETALKQALFSRYRNLDIAYCLNNMGVNFFDLKKYDKAIEVYCRALNNKKLESEAPEIFCRLLDNLGRAKLRLKDFNGVLPLHRKASQLYKTLHSEGTTANLLFVSEYYLALNDSLKSKQYAQEALKSAKIMKAPNEIQLCLRQLSKTDLQNKLTYAKQYIHLSDSMQQNERRVRNKFAKIAYETQEILDEKEKAIYQKNIYMGVGLLILIIVALLVKILSQTVKQKELQFIMEQQKDDEDVYQLIQLEQNRIDQALSIEKKRMRKYLNEKIVDNLVSTRFNLQALIETTTDQKVKDCSPFVEGIYDIEKEIKSIVNDLNSAIFLNAGSFEASLQNLIESQPLSLEGKCDFKICKDIDWSQFESRFKINFYRIIQEALNNIYKHAKAKHYKMNINITKDKLILEISDDGIGFSTDKTQKGLGLSTMEKRVKFYRGTFEIFSKIGNGTILRIVFPLLNP